MSMKITSVEQFKQVLADHPKVVADFFATWCGPCKMLSPILEKVAEANADVCFVKIDTDEMPTRPLSIEYGIQYLPTLVFIKNGSVVNKEVGFSSQEELQAKLESVFA